MAWSYKSPIRKGQKVFKTFGTVSGKYLDGSLITREGVVVVKSKKHFENGRFYTLKGRIHANQEKGTTSIVVY